MRYKIFILLVLSVILPLFAGCATRGYVPPPQVKPPFQVKERAGVYHQVKKSETLYRIAQAYGVDIEKIIAVNRIPNPACIEEGQLIFIPGVSEIISVKPDGLSRSGFIWPVKGEVISFFGEEVDRISNKGIDIRAREGTEVKASKAGVVSFCNEYFRGYGKVIFIDHGDGYHSVYAHNAENLVRAGQRVKQGEIIARVGKTGRATEPGLHFEIRKGSVPQNPVHFLP